MKRKINWWSLGVRLPLIVLLCAATVKVAVPILAPWVAQSAAQKVDKWQRLLEDGDARMAAGEFVEAEGLFRAALEYVRETLIIMPSREATSAYRVGMALLRREQHEKARSYFERNLVIRKEVDGELATTQIPALERLIDVCVETSDLDAALDFGIRAVAIREAQDLSPNPELAVALRDLARVYQKQENFAAALAIRERVVHLEEARQLAGARDLGIAYYRQGLMHNALLEFEAAEDLYRKSLEVFEGSVDPGEKCFVALIREYAHLLDVTGRTRDASRLRLTWGNSAGP